MIQRGGLYWAELGPAVGSRPAKAAPGRGDPGPFVQRQPTGHGPGRGRHLEYRAGRDAGQHIPPASVTGLPRDSVVNITAIVTLNKTDLTERIGTTPQALKHEIDRGLRRVLELGL